MKVGILTFHLAHNYGAVLQCYALQELLRSMGHDVYVIDYQQPFMVEHFRPKRYWGFRSLISTLFYGDMKEYIYHSRLPYVRSRNFKHFRQKYLRFTDKCYSVDDIPSMDLYIVGSDQPWNPDLTGGPDLVYWGQFKRPQGSKLITYAMSGSEKAISKVGWEYALSYTKNFDALSFREESITHKFEKLTGRRCDTVLDPTLIADAKLWGSLINNKWENRKYVLLYHVGGPKDVIKSMTCRSKQMAEEQRIEFIDASRYLYTPEDFVSLIKHATFVVTTSFHAMVFSLVFQKKFCVVKTGQASDTRFIDLLCKINAIGHMVSPEDIVGVHSLRPIFRVADSLKEDSLSFIRKFA